MQSVSEMAGCEAHTVSMTRAVMFVVALIIAWSNQMLASNDMYTNGQTHTDWNHYIILKMWYVHGYVFCVCLVFHCSEHMCMTCG